MLPEDNNFPDLYYEEKKILCQMGLEYVKIHAFPNDYVLYRKEYENFDQCLECSGSRYKLKNNNGDDNDSVSKKRPHAKVLWYLPIISRLKRLFANVNDVKNMRWHAVEGKYDGNIHHEADSLQWKKINSLFSDFGLEPRNLTLGLAADEMKPFGNLSTNHSLWHVRLTIYNLPLWLCMKRKYMMLSVDVDDAYSGEQLKMRAMLFCTINDSLAYGNLAGYSVKEYKVFSICEFDTCFHQLKFGKKTVYLGHQKFLKPNHPYRKTKDNKNSRLDMVKMGIPQQLAPEDRGKRSYLPLICHTLSKKEKKSFCEFLYGIKVPQGYSSNIKKLVSMKHLKLIGLKSHDCHVLMQQLLPVAIRGILPKNIRVTITRLCLFFNSICNKVLDFKKIDELEEEVAIILYQLEMYFPPSFFDIMVHLLVYLV
ncbi:uncharacterized protein LOC127080005 [Lathyrus oleraceus]|uniref:uncharacterized protein LOC127080005 n=1 Tax=Pisum sativum TaxID=3888 RepID=UPI0021D36F0A|nr:uncharacterized protein LOC127080005 [Pisum sativum]